MARRDPASGAKPFLRWVGGKRYLVRHLVDFLPDDLDRRVYREPFLGAANLFFATRPLKAHLSDANAALIDCYVRVRDFPSEVAGMVRTHEVEDRQAYYYQVRA